jgi:hypothetical protein
MLAFIHAKYPRYPSTYVKHPRFHLAYAKRPRYKSIVRLVTCTMFSDTVLNDMHTRVYLSTYANIVTPQRTKQDRIRLCTVLSLQQIRGITLPKQ